MLSFFMPTYKLMGTALNLDKYSLIREKFVGVVGDNQKAILTIDEMLSGYAQAYADYRVYKASYLDSQPYTENCPESNIGKPVERFEFENHFYSRSSLNYLLGINFMK